MFFKRKLAPHFVKIFLPIQILALFGFIILVRDFSYEKLLLIFFGWLLIGGYGIAIGFHRLLSHRSFKTYVWVERLLGFIGIFGGQGSSLFWSAVHRGLHHPFSDTERDLHSPIHGKFHAYIGWQMYLDPRKVTFKRCADLLSDKWQLFYHRHYNRIFWGTIILCALINWKFSLFFLVVPSFISMHTENCVDVFCHLKNLGYRNFETEDNSVNIWWLGYFGFGQGWHNNHHDHQNSPVYSSRWWEIDPTRAMIFLIKKHTS